MLHRFRPIEDAKAADRWIGGVFEFEKIFEREFFEARHGEGREFRACERPRYPAFRLGWFAAACDEEQEPARAEKTGNIFDRPGAKRGGENLERVGLKNKMEKAAPGGRRLEQVGGEVFDGCVGKAFARKANRGFRDIECRGAEAPRGKLLGIITEAAADRQGCFSGSWLWMRIPEIKQARIRAEIGPRNGALPSFALAVEVLEPANGVALAIEFVGQFSRACAVWHFPQ